MLITELVELIGLIERLDGISGISSGLDDEETDACGHDGGGDDHEDDAPLEAAEEVAASTRFERLSAHGTLCVGGLRAQKQADKKCHGCGDDECFE